MDPSDPSGDESARPQPTRLTRPPPDPGAGKWCKGCRYSLRGLGPSGECPECGRAFDLSKPWTYAKEEVPAWNMAWSWPRVFAMAMAAGLFLIGRVVYEQVWLLAILAYPFWLCVIAFLVTFALTPTATKVGVNMFIGVVVGALIGWSSNSWLGLLGVGLGPVAGLLVTYAEVLGLRSK